MGAGAVLARGCTSGQALTGGAMLSVGSWIFIAAAFGSAYAFARPLRALWPAAGSAVVAMTDSLVLAFVIGVAFGWTLERAGLADAPKLARQFYLTDLTVFKVMFSALVTAMLGLFWLGRLGVVDVSAIYVPETFMGPQLLGGLVFGLGFVACGLCPGTSCVSAATGRLDGVP